ncbi:MAG: hypothetical protein HY913_09685 [Desulfomonile tiedjei]|nr:hypothetical protein [Desulfomonile tiedjei]
MIVNDNEVRRPELRGPRNGAGWTSLHSWIFLAIVALGLLVIAAQNRYHYLSPQGLGKAYRIDKVFGGIQEFDPGKGWITAQLQSMGPPQGLSMMEPPSMGSQAVPMTGGIPPSTDLMQPGVAKEDIDASRGQRPQLQAKEAPAMSKEDRFKAFQRAFPEFGQDEFQLADDDLYPFWKKTEAPNGTWPEFLGMYREFIQWWADAGSPPEPGFKLWKDFRSAKGKR